MHITRLDARLSVADQIRPEDLPLLIEAGYRAVVNNRPDHEELGQPTDAQLRGQAHRLGLAYIHIPIVTGHQSDADAIALNDFVARAGGPVLAFCRTGNRSSRLWARARQLG
jgi:sulfide:quinone oxidoreductase